MYSGLFVLFSGTPHQIIIIRRSTEDCG